MQDIDPICVLGQGAFGKVILARYLGKLYALKMLWKSHVVKMGVQEHVKREAKILMSCRNDFLVNLYATGKSEDRLFMLMEPVLGGELLTHLRVGGPSRGPSRSFSFRWIVPKTATNNWCPAEEEAAAARGRREVLRGLRHPRS